METKTPKPKKTRTTQKDKIQFLWKLIVFQSVFSLLIVIAVLFSFFRNAPVNPLRGQSELTTWTKQQAQKLPATYRSEIKMIFREAYQEAAADIQSQHIVTTADARLRLSQLIQSKILSLNRLSSKPKELETIIDAMKPLSEAIGDHLDSDVKSGKMQDDLESVQKAFKEISEGLK